MRDINFKFLYIYCITNKSTNKKYIGSHICYKDNPYDDGYWGSSKYLNNEIKLLGKENFIKEIIEFIDLDKLNLLYEIETFHILKNNTIEPNGYNRVIPGVVGYTDQSGKILVHNDKRQKFIKLEELHIYLKNKWIAGRLNKEQQCYINRGDEQKSINKNELDEWIKLGWRKGLSEKNIENRKNKTKGRIRVNNGLYCISITKDELEYYLAGIIKASDLKEFELKFNNDYIETKHDVGKRFSETLGTLGK